MNSGAQPAPQQPSQSPQQGQVPLHVAMDFLTRNIQRLEPDQQWQALYTLVASLARKVPDNVFRDAVLDSVNECAARGRRCRARRAA